MIIRNLILTLLILAISVVYAFPFAQSRTIETNKDSIVKFSANKRYKSNFIKEFLLGKHYRKEWATPVEAPVFNITKRKLHVVKKGGSRQTVNLRLIDSSGREYVLRSIDKTPKKALPADLRKTFLADILQDQTSTGHPYAAFIIPPLAEAAGVFHTNPQLVYVPYDTAFDSFAKVLANKPALFELRPDGPMQDIPNFGNPNNVVGTVKMFEHCFEDNDNVIDQVLFARSRLFDMWLGDWSRHEDQWRWGEFQKIKGSVYRPIPRDRDHVFFKFDGFLPSFITTTRAVRHLKNFGSKIKDLKGLNNSARNLDRDILTELTEKQWIKIGNDLKNALTDSVIEAAVAMFPPAIHAISGSEIEKKLKARRAQLPEIAKEYYKILAKQVSILGSAKHEQFEIERKGKGVTEITVFKIYKTGEKDTIIYHRIFYPKETKEIHIYGLGGKDRFVFSGEEKKLIKIRIIEGKNKAQKPDKPATDSSDRDIVFYNTKQAKNIRFYKLVNDKRNYTPNDSAYDFKQSYNYNYIAPILYPEYNSDDGLFIGAGILMKTYGFRKFPYASFQKFGINYATRTKAFNFKYYADFKNIYRQWNIDFQAMLMGPKYVVNFFGFGNESTLIPHNISYYRVKFNELSISPSLYKKLNKKLLFSIGPVFQNIKVVKTPARFIATENAQVNDKAFSRNQFWGIKTGLTYSNVYDRLLPLKGYEASFQANGVKQFNSSIQFINLHADLSFYFTLKSIRFLTFATRLGGAHNLGDYYFYQANMLGGTTNLRGYRRTRFYGRSSVYNNNELRLKIAKFSTYLVPFQLGLLGFFDQGRVWADKEQSDKWHVGYGPGIWIIIYNRITFTGCYGTSPQEGSYLTLKTGFLF